MRVKDSETNYDKPSIFVLISTLIKNDYIERKVVIETVNVSRNFGINIFIDLLEKMNEVNSYHTSYFI